MASLFSHYVFAKDSRHQFTDLVLRVGKSGKEFKVHKFIVCPQSNLFMTACTAPFVEAKQNSILLPEDDPEIIECVIDFLYHQKYNNEYEKSNEKQTNIGDCIANNESVGRDEPSKGKPDDAQYDADTAQKEFTRSNEKSHGNLELRLATTRRRRKPQQFSYLQDDQQRIDLQARVYTCALRLGISMLCDHSFGKVQSYDPFLLASTILPVTLEHIYNNTLPEDRLRHLTTETCVQYHECLNDPVLRHNPNGDEVVKVIQKHETMAWEIGVTLWKKIRVQEEAMLRQRIVIMELRHNHLTPIRRRRGDKRAEADKGLSKYDSDDDTWYDCSDS